MADDDKVRPAIHLCTVPATSLPGLVADSPVVDTGRYEFGRRIVGKLLEAHLSEDGRTIAGKVELVVYGKREPAWAGGQRSVCRFPAQFVVSAASRVTAHLPADVLARTPGAFDVEFG